MQIGMVGLGRMGGNMTERLLRGGHQVVVFDRDRSAVEAAVARGALGVDRIESLVDRLDQPATIWMLIPAGDPVDQTIAALAPRLGPGGILVDGGNSNYKDTMRRSAGLGLQGIELVDCGTSGGIWGLEQGYCLMVGGSPKAVERLQPVFATLAQPDGFAHVGPAGAGHYVKMIHNGIEYGLLQAYAEGYEILRQTGRFDLDLHQIARVWNRGSVVRSWLNELAERAFARDPGLGDVSDWVADSGEGRWTLQEAIDLDVPAPALALALFARFRSRQKESFGGKVIAALRREFGGHPVHTP